jgi:two-component system sensor histidine kinase UhpB
MQERPVTIAEMADAAATPMTGRPDRGRRVRRTLFRRLFLAYAAVAGVAVAVLIIAPIRVSYPTTGEQVAIILVGFLVTLVVYRGMLRRALAPLGRLTTVMRRIDPLAPGQRVEADLPDEEVAALADAFNEMLDRLEDERRESGRRALAAQESERRRIARELHDEIGQLLTGLLLRSETLVRRAPQELRSDIEELREASRAAAEEVRVIARRLRPEALDELGLQSALLALSTALEKRTGIRVHRELERELQLSDEEELVIYRIAQESLTNVVRHSGADQVDLSLSRVDGRVQLRVRDDGAGIDPSAELASTGIRGMRERALLVGGQLSIRRVQPHGTEVVLDLPGQVA